MLNKYLIIVFLMGHASCAFKAPAAMIPVDNQLDDQHFRGFVALVTEWNTKRQALDPAKNSKAYDFTIPSFQSVPMLNCLETVWNDVRELGGKEAEEVVMHNLSYIGNLKGIPLLATCAELHKNLVEALGHFNVFYERLVAKRRKAKDVSE